MVIEEEGELDMEDLLRLGDEEATPPLCN